MKKKILTVAVILGIIATAYIIKKNRESVIQKQTRFVMDTYCSIQIPGKKEVLPFIERGFQRIEEIDKKFNVLNPQSPLYEFNRNSKAFTDREICNLVAVALQISKSSRGSFDITVYPLLHVWGFYSGTYKVPKKSEIDEALILIGYENLAIRGDTLIKLKNDIAIDLGGIAKGYALKEAVRELKTAGVSSALVDFGGDLYALGTHNGSPWKVGIRNPRGEGVIGVLEVSDVSVVTSGDYERFFEKEGVKYHHIIDPQTGYPARNLMSVTVICEDPVNADAWSTALFVMEPEKALHTVEETPYLEALLVTAKGEVLYSSGLKDNLEMKKTRLEDDT